MLDGAEQRKWREGTESLPKRDLGALYQAQHCESHKISKLQKAKREGSKSVAICTIPNCVYLWQIQPPLTKKKGITWRNQPNGKSLALLEPAGLLVKGLNKEIKRNRKGAKCSIATIQIF